MKLNEFIFKDIEQRTRALLRNFLSDQGYGGKDLIMDEFANFLNNVAWDKRGLDQHDVDDVERTAANMLRDKLKV